MIFYSVFIVIIAASVAVIAYIVLSKFSQLTLIDAESMPMERDLTKKKDLIKSRVDRNVSAWWKKIVARLSPRIWRVRRAFRAQYGKLLRINHKYSKGGVRRVCSEDLQKQVADMMDEAKKLAAAGRFTDAEREYVRAIHKDPRNAEAYERLGEMYLEDGQYGKARETFNFLVKISTGGVSGSATKESDVGPLAKYHVKYGMAAAALGDNNEARAAYEKAIYLEPSNPRYLDLLLEECILEGDLLGARDVLGKFKAVNPENKKLEAIEERIQALENNGSEQA